ncbi:MAG: hypothetical protein LQ340_003854 [Diploschistes diacapsis]|nr:MAG: hypothetical protein LQ340_003854 [Diploschistes diacapsis]
MASIHSNPESAAGPGRNGSTARSVRSQPKEIQMDSLHQEGVIAAEGNTPMSNSDMEKNEEAGPTRSIKGLPWAILIMSLLSAHFLCAMDNTIVADIQGPIIRDLGEYDKFPWISVGFELGAASANLFWGHINRLFNKKWTFLVCMCIFEVGSIVCGSATTLDALIVGRVVCGFGGTGFVLSVMNIIAVLSLQRERALYVSLAGTAWAVGAIIGPVVGGAINDSKAGWRWCFYINILIAAVALPGLLFILPSLPSSSFGLGEKLRRLDVVGFVLWTGAICCLIIAISFGGTVYAWDDGRNIGLFAAGGVLALLFVIQQKWAYKWTTSKEHRYFPVHFFKRLDMTILFIQMVSVSAAFFLTIYFLPLYFQFVQGDSALESGVRLLPFLFVGILFLILNGAIMGKTGYYMPWFLVGSALVVVAAALMRTLGVNSGTAYIYGYSVVMGVGIGAFSQASMSVAQAKVPPEEVAVAVSLISCGQITGIMVGFSVAYSIFLNTATNQIAALLPQAPKAAIQSAIVGVESNVFANVDANTKLQVLQAVANSINNVWIQVLAGGALSFVFALFMKREKLVFKK